MRFISIAHCFEIDRAQRAADEQNKGGAASLTANGGITSDPAVMAPNCHDVLAEHLDFAQGSQVTDKDIYRCASECPSASSSGSGHSLLVCFDMKAFMPTEHKYI
jgi:hypothetical protein